MKNLIITQEIVVAHYFCPLKAYQIMFEENKVQMQCYVKYLMRRRRENEKNFLNEPKKLSASRGSAIKNFEIKTKVSYQTGIFSVQDIHLIEIKTHSRFDVSTVEPLIFSTSMTVKVPDRICASYIGWVLTQIRGKPIKKAVVICLDGCARSIKLNPEKTHQILNTLTEWNSSKPERPPIIIGKHCPLCGFETNCISEAKRKDSLGLLGNMTPKILKKYNSKGIFSINQLSYIYKPRRRSRYLKDSSPRHRYELQALAIRTKKIYTCDVIPPITSDFEIYIDIETFPENSFHYLIGVLISYENFQNYIPLWANEIKDEREIWQKFVQIIKRYNDAPIFHYGNYDRKVIQLLANRYNTDVSKLLSRMHNVNSLIFGRIYFPTLTNKLKDICNYLGFNWSHPESTGLNSIVWRYEFSSLGDLKRKIDLITYNEEDCFYLKKLKDIIHDISCDSDRLDFRTPTEQRQRLNRKKNQIFIEFTGIIQSAHGAYEQLKISKKKKAKVNVSSNKINDNRGRKRTIPKSKIDKIVVVPRGRVCPNHKRPLVASNQIAEKIIIDIVSTQKGVKRLITKYIGKKGRCPNCSDRYVPPSIRRMGRGTLYGHGLKAWVSYQRLAMMLPYRKISQLMEDSFNLWINNGTLNAIFQSFSANYSKSEKLLIDRLLQSPIIHADETQINIKGSIQYIWVFTDGKHVIFKLTSKRDSSIVYDMLDMYDGVLISDFFSGYDGVNCHQQKCLVHLIRDINTDLRKAPFDFEFENFVYELRNLVVPIFNVIEKYGLKKRNLNKFRKPVKFFYEKHILKTTYKSDITTKYQKRFKRYKESLFTFLKYDGVPWNNNMAERALRHIAVQRKISGSFSVNGMVGYLRMLGVMQSCRFQNKPFLKFLMSGEQDVDLFKAPKNIKGWLMT